MINIRWRHIAILALTTWLVACSTVRQFSAPQPNLEETAAPSVASRALSDGSSSECNVPPDSSQSQYLIGYGSLMEDDSRKRTSPQAGPAHPIEVKGYRRGWFARAEAVGFSTTYLGVLPKQESYLNAVIYQVDPVELMATDKREVLYCRKRIDALDIKLLEGEAFQAPNGQIWIYVNKPHCVATPNSRYPIVQSYVDIFVLGCLEQEQRFGLTDFSRQCLSTTTDWSKHWVNDRIYPRRPFISSRKQDKSIICYLNNCRGIFLTSE